MKFWLSSWEIGHFFLHPNFTIIFAAAAAAAAAAADADAADDDDDDVDIFGTPLWEMASIKINKLQRFSHHLSKPCRTKKLLKKSVINRLFVKFQLKGYIGPLAPSFIPEKKRVGQHSSVAIRLVSVSRCPGFDSRNFQKKIQEILMLLRLTNSTAGLIIVDGRGLVMFINPVMSLQVAS